VKFKLSRSVEIVSAQSSQSALHAPRRPGSREANDLPAQQISHRNEAFERFEVEISVFPATNSSMVKGGLRDRNFARHNPVSLASFACFFEPVPTLQF
jgi:hypothetical protein